MEVSSPNKKGDVGLIRNSSIITFNSTLCQTSLDFLS
jgi:hypothetical protein